MSKNNQKQKIIDAHSHIGRDASGPSASLAEYLKEAIRENITKALLMPVPTPILQLTKNHTIIPSLREVQKDGSIQYLEKHQTDGKEEKQPVSTNPYKEINNQLFRDIVKNNQKQSQTHFYVVPLLHPILDTQDYVETLLHNNQVPALKIHGIATYTSPKDIPNRLIQGLQYYHKPLIVHTDYENTEKNQTNTLSTLRNLNTPQSWIAFGLDNKVKVYITHAARLSKEAIALAKGNDSIGFGMGPDLLLTKEQDRVYTKNTEVIDWCLQHIPLNQLMFDIDYGRNLEERGQWNKKDKGYIERFLMKTEQYKLTEEETNAILYQNAKTFFNL